MSHPGGQACQTGGNHGEAADWKTLFAGDRSPVDRPGSRPLPMAIMGMQG
jgi:hypothetical protein